MNNYTANASVGGDNDQYNARVDHTFSEKQRFFVRYTYWTNLNLPIDPYKTKTCVDRCTETFNTNQAVVGDTYLLLADADRATSALSYLRFSYDRTSLTAGYDLTQLGWPASMNNQVIFRVLPHPTGHRLQRRLEHQRHGQHHHRPQRHATRIAPNLTKIWGSHTFKFGGEFRRNYPQLLSAEQPVGNVQLRRAHDVGEPVRRRRHGQWLCVVPARLRHRRRRDQQRPGGRPADLPRATTRAISGRSAPR